MTPPTEDGRNAAPLLLFQTLWGFNGDLRSAIVRARQLGFDGLEVNLNHHALDGWSAQGVREHLDRANLELIIELVSGGDYVPDLLCSWEQHLADLDGQLDRAGAMRPRRISVITGSDSWADDIQDRFLEALLDRIEACDYPVSLETHRSRSLFNPWRCAALIAKHPRLRLTADISHWCAVSERLMLPELEPVSAIADPVRLVTRAQEMLWANRLRWARTTTGNTRPGEQLWVYGRAGQQCRRCATPIARSGQTNSERAFERVSYWCPSCQS